MDYSRGRCLLYSLRQERGWTQTDVAIRTGWKPSNNKGIKPRMISYYEAYDGQGNGKRMGPEAMYTLAQVFGVRMETLYEWILTDEAE